MSPHYIPFCKCLKLPLFILNCLHAYNLSFLAKEKASAQDCILNNKDLFSMIVQFQSNTQKIMICMF